MWRVTIKRDVYDQQCSSKVERWTGTEWAFVTLTPVTAMEIIGITPYTDSDQWVEVIARDLVRMLMEALDAMGVHEKYTGVRS